jgi:amino acid transporter
VAYSYSWKIAILVGIVMLVVVASYRQKVHAYPSGGGDYEVATVNLGPTLASLWRRRSWWITS